MKRLDPAVKYGNVGDAYVVMEEAEDGDLVWWDEAANEIEQAQARVCSLWSAALDGPVKASADDSAEMAHLVARTRNVAGALRTAEAARVAAVSVRSQLEATIARQKLTDSDHTALSTAVFELKERLGTYRAFLARCTPATDEFVVTAYKDGIAACEAAIEVCKRIGGKR